MKHFLTLISLVFLSAAAFGQTFQYRPTAYTQPFVSTINSSAAAQTYLGLPSPTNTALLDAANQTFTGTNTFTPEKFFPANGVRYRTLFVTNVFVSSVIYATNAATAGSPTNAGENVHATTFIDINLPRLLSTNSTLAFSLGFIRTNAQVDRTGIAVYCGTNTNCVYWFPSYIGNGTTTPQLFNDGGTMRVLFSNYGAFTNQIPASQNSPTYQTNMTGFFLVNTSTNFNLKVAGAAFSSAGPNTNSTFLFKAIEIVD